MIPTVSAGWDPRPRHDYPCPWGGAGSPSYIVDPTMAELEAHTGPSHTRFVVAMSGSLNRTLLRCWAAADGLEWVGSNRHSAEANAMILSAWNEHDEGHWIAPALEKYGGAEKLQAVKKAIDGVAARRADYWQAVGGEQ